MTNTARKIITSLVPPARPQPSASPARPSPPLSSTAPTGCRQAGAAPRPSTPRTRCGSTAGRPQGAKFKLLRNGAVIANTAEPGLQLVGRVPDRVRQLPGPGYYSVCAQNTARRTPSPPCSCAPTPSSDRARRDRAGLGEVRFRSPTLARRPGRGRCGGSPLPPECRWRAPWQTASVRRAPELRRPGGRIARSTSSSVRRRGGGPGRARSAGIGKSTLLRQFAARCRARGQCLHMDARDLPPTLEALGYRLSPVLDAGSDPPDGRPDRRVRTTRRTRLGLPRAARARLPADSSSSWPASNRLGRLATDAGWAPILHSLRLQPQPDDCSSYLNGRGVPPSAFVGDRVHPRTPPRPGPGRRSGQGEGHLRAVDSADVVRVLIDRMLDEVPSPTHRAALEAAAQVRVIDEPLLAALLDRRTWPDVVRLDAGAPFVDAGRPACTSTIWPGTCWPPTCGGGMPTATPSFTTAPASTISPGWTAWTPAQAAALLDLIYLHPDCGPSCRRRTRAQLCMSKPLGRDDPEAVGDMVARHEGTESADIARHWLPTRPEAWLVVRGSEERRTVRSACCRWSRWRSGTTRPSWRPEPSWHHPPLRPGETATLIRFWLSRDVYQSVSPPAQSLIATQFARHFLTTPGLSVTLLPFAHPQEWEAFCSYADQRRARQRTSPSEGGRTRSSCTTGVRSAGRLGRPAVPAGDRRAPVTSSAEPPELVLGEPDFAVAVRQALRDYTRPDRLRDKSAAAVPARDDQTHRRGGAGSRPPLLQTWSRQRPTPSRSRPPTVGCTGCWCGRTCHRRPAWSEPPRSGPAVQHLPPAALHRHRPRHHRALAPRVGQLIFCPLAPAWA